MVVVVVVAVAEAEEVAPAPDDRAAERLAGRVGIVYARPVVSERPTPWANPATRSSVPSAGRR